MTLAAVSPQQIIIRSKQLMAGADVLDVENSGPYLWQDISLTFTNKCRTRESTGYVDAALHHNPLAVNSSMVSTGQKLGSHILLLLLL